MKVSEYFKPVLAKIKYQNSLGLSEWYEVVFHNGHEWRSYEFSNTFEDGHKVIGWVYADKCFTGTCTNNDKQI